MIMKDKLTKENDDASKLKLAQFEESPEVLVSLLNGQPLPSMVCNLTLDSYNTFVFIYDVFIPRSPQNTKSRPNLRKCKASFGKESS